MEALARALSVMAWLAALAFLSKILTFKRHQLKLAPGPKPWPIIGNLNLIGPLLHQSIHKLSQRYGPIMQLTFGSFSVVVASSPEMAKQILKTHDHIFASRPQTAAGKYTTYNYTDILWAPYGPYFRQGRKIYMSELFTSKRLESYEYIRVEERKALVSRLCALTGKPVRVKEHLLRLTLSVISRIVLGKMYFSESESETSTGTQTPKEFQQMLDEWFLLNSKLNIGDWIPWLNFLDLQGYVKRMKALTKKFDQFYDHVFDDHKVKRGVGDFVPNDMVDLLLQLVDDPNTVVKLTYDNVKGLTQVYVDLSRGFFLLLLLLFDIYLLNHCFLYKFKNLL
jgi:cytochrome P450